MEKNEKVIYGKFDEEEQNKIIEKLINTQIKNRQLLDEIRKEFESKNLQYSKASAVFNLTKKFEELTTNEKIAFVTASYRVLQKEDLIPSRFFGDNALIEYKKFINQDKKFETIRLEQVRRLNDYEYQGYIPDRVIALCMKNGLLHYNTDTQRPYEVKAVGDKGQYLRKLDINQKNVDEMVELMKQGKFEDTEITLNIRIIEGCYADFKFTPQWNDIGVFEVTPNYDTNSEHFTIVDIADGTHRIFAKQKYVEWYYTEYNEYPPDNQGIKVAIKVRTVEQCKEFIRQVFQRADVIDKEYIENLKADEYSIFTKDMVNKSDILRGNVGERYEDVLVNKKITNYNLLKETIKKFVKVEFDSIVRKNGKLNSLAENIDTIIKYMCDKYYSNDLNSMIAEKTFMSNGIFTIYLILANMISENIINKTKYEQIIDILFELKDGEEFKELKLKNKIIDLDEVKKFIDNNFIEVIENV